MCAEMRIIMNKRTVNISSLVLLLSLLSLITTMCLYYIVPMHYVSVIFAAAASVLLAHFFLESSLNYDYNFLHAASMTVALNVMASLSYLVATLRNDLSLAKKHSTRWRSLYAWISYFRWTSLPGTGGITTSWFWRSANASSLLAS